jgi:hypothetical protein
LIKAFYQHYRQTGRAAEALSRAKRDMLAEYGRDTNPFYWAAFIFEGLPTAAVNTYDSDSKQNILASSAGAHPNGSKYREVRPN